MKSSRARKIAKALERRAARRGVPLEGRDKALLIQVATELKTEQTLADDGMEKPEYRRS